MIIGGGTWVLVAAGSKFLLFRNQGDAAVLDLVTVAHEEVSNPPTSEQGSDSPGRTFSSIGAGQAGGGGQRRSSYADTDWHRQTEERFAAHVADILNRTTEHETGAIVVIAPAKTLGDLRKHYAAGVAQRLQAEIAKDLAGHTTHDVIDVILAHTH